MIASHVDTICCNHLAKLLQKIIASQKNQHIAFRKLDKVSDHVTWSHRLPSFWTSKRFGQHYHLFDAISPGLGNIIIILSMPSSYCSENSTIAGTTLRGLKLCQVFWTIRRWHQKDDDDVAQAFWVWLFRKLYNRWDHVTWSETLSSFLNNQKIVSKRW